MVKIKKLAIVMVGAPGSGKGTQGEILERETGFRRYVMSDLIKLELKPGTELYERVINNGILLGDSDVFEIFRRHFKSENQIIIDGIPRTQDQAYWLYGFLAKHDYDIKLVYLEVDENKLLKRITSRFSCLKCHEVYNEITKKPKKAGICDFDSSKLVQRKDDNAKVFSQRIKIFDDVKKIIVEVYSDDLVKVNGDQDINKVSSDLLKKLI